MSERVIKTWTPRYRVETASLVIEQQTMLGETKVHHEWYFESAWDSREEAEARVRAVKSRYPGVRIVEVTE